ncbi:hypothetical protein F2P81_013037 [Scophthalmus maximus]|uniref:Uncharacterized protein n=1 Tax=Scophthalmus maximus TaxID=52904 RepID=A0A6A4SRI2_SCOMX|nr:hypothetical protein F2P81_013037 [Scophthalmus maximus]
MLNLSSNNISDCCSYHLWASAFNAERSDLDLVEAHSCQMPSYRNNAFLLHELHDLMVHIAGIVVAFQAYLREQQKLKSESKGHTFLMYYEEFVFRAV